MNQEIQPVMIRVNKEKYTKVRHELLDKGVTVNAFINDLIDKHLASQNQAERLPMERKK